MQENSVYINFLIDQLRSINETIQENFKGFNSYQLNWKPGPDSWSIAQCLDHLIVSDEAYFPEFSRKIKLARQKPAGKEFKAGLFGTWFIKSIESGSKTSYKSPKIFEPSQSEIISDIVKKFEAHNKELSGIFSSAIDLDLNKTTVISPVSALIRFRMGDSFRLLAVHQQRHLKQAFRVKNNPEFPG